MDMGESSSQPKSVNKFSTNYDSSEVISVDKKERKRGIKDVHFSGIGEEVSFMSATANSRACTLKYEGDYFILEALFTNEAYKNLSAEQVLGSVIPVIEKYDISYLWNIFKNIVERRMASLSCEKMISETEWLKDPTIRLAKILYYLPLKKMPSVVLEHLHSNLPEDMYQECVFLDSLRDSYNASSPLRLEGNIETGETMVDGEDMLGLLSKIDELQHRTTCLSDENTQVQEMLVEAGRKLEAASEENLHLKHQLFRAKVDLKEIDDLTSEVWNLKAKLLSFEHSEKKKRKKLREIEEQKVILFKRVQDLEGKLHHWHAIVEDAKNELNALKNLVVVQEQKLLFAVQETTVAEVQLNELTLVKSELERSVHELLEANDALRSDKRVIENNLAEMEFLLAKRDGNEVTSNLSCENILFEDDSFAPEDEGFSSSSDNHLNFFSMGERISKAAFTLFQNSIG